MRPAVRIIFAPIMSRTKGDRDRGLFVHGTTQNRTITIDPRSSEIGKTLLHEMIHLRHPDWSEEAVVSETRLRWGKMSWKEKARLLRLLGSAHLEGEETWARKATGHAWPHSGEAASGARPSPPLSG